MNNIIFQQIKDPDTSISEINRSLKLLDETLSSPQLNVGSPRVHRIRGTPGGHLQRSRVTHGVTPKSKFDTSLTLQQNELDLLRRQNISGVDSADVTSFSRTVPWRTVCDKLFSDFLEAMNYESMGHCLTECVPRFIKSCEETLNELKQDTAKMSAEVSVLNFGAENISVEDAIIAKLWLQGEYNIWRLLYSLYRDRLEADEKMSPLPLASETNVSEKTIVEQLYRTDSYTRECQIVIDWLEKTALEQNVSSVRMQYFTDKTIAWENTLHQLQRKMENIPYSSSNVLVSKLDPDAPRRESRSLHDLDKEDEDRLMHNVFLEVRCGQLDRAQDLLMHCGQHLKAIILEGWKPFHDPNYNSNNSDSKVPVTGVFNRDIWKLCALRMVQDKKVPTFERATFAAFCGYLPALVEVCHTWEDLLWAFLRVQVDIRVEEEIREMSVRTYTALPEEYWQNKMSLEELFAELEASKEASVTQEAKDPIHIIQKLIIMDDIPLLLDHMEQWVEEGVPQIEVCCSPHFLRCMAHVVLFLRSIHRCDEKQGNTVLQAYVKVLMEKQEAKLVAYYVSTLPPEQQVELYARFLRDIVGTEDRRLCLELADNAGLDVDIIAKTVVENIRRCDDGEAGMPHLQAELTPLDLEKISALDWLTFYPEQRLEAMWQTNAIIRHFLAAGKTRAAREAFDKLPASSVETIMKQFQVDETTPIPPRVSSTIREYLCIDVYLNAEEGFTEWYQLFHNGRPQEPARPSGTVTFTRQVAYEHVRNNYETELELWKLTMAQQTKTVKSLLYNVLMFPNGGWMVDEEPWSEWGEGDREELQNREQQMNSLRQLYIHKVVLLLLCVMHNMEEDNECIKMSVTIAAEYHQLYKVFTKQQLRELRLNICDSSLSLLDRGQDAWGFPTTS